MLPMQPGSGRRRPLPFGAFPVWFVVWVLVAATGSWLVWQVVSRAGEEVASDTGAAVAPAPAEATRPAPAGADASGTPSPAPGAGASAAAPPTQRTWTGRGGSVTVACDAQRIRLIRAVPSTEGYAVDVEESGPDEVRLHFEGREDRDGEETEVRSRCERGTPQFEVGVED